MAYSYGLYSYGPHSYGLYSYGLWREAEPRDTAAEDGEREVHRLRPPRPHRLERAALEEALALEPDTRRRPLPAEPPTELLRCERVGAALRLWRGVWLLLGVGEDGEALEAAEERLERDVAALRRVELQPKELAVRYIVMAYIVMAYIVMAYLYVRAI